VAFNRFTETKSGEDRREIFCDCCGREKLGEIRGDKLVIMDRRHGRKHIAVIALSDLPIKKPLTTG
jgi:hypothetical protein